jgi:hypothetical protein
MAQEEFEIAIGPDGKVTIQTRGVKGAKCLDYAELFAQIIGREESRQLTNEYYEAEAEVRRHVEQKQRR